MVRECDRIRNLYRPAQNEPRFLAGTLAAGAANNIDRELSLGNVIARLGRSRAALLAAVVQELLQESGCVPGIARCAVLEIGAEGTCAGNLLTSVVVAVAVLDAVHNRLEVDEVASGAVGRAEARATAVDTEGRDGA